MSAASDRDELRELLSQIDRAWLEGRPHDLERYFHPEMVIEPPGEEPRAIGREACIRSYEDFCRAAKVLRYKSDEPLIEVWRDTAVVTSGFTIVYEINGERSSESGRDVFVFIRQGERWLAVWRSLFGLRPA